MEIKVETTRMIKILMANGASEVEAKATVFDLIVESNELKKTRLQPSPLTPEEVAMFEEDEEEETPEEKEKKAEIRRKRVNFSNFGGEAQPLT